MQGVRGEYLHVSEAFCNYNSTSTFHHGRVKSENSQKAATISQGFPLTSATWCPLLHHFIHRDEPPV